MVGLETAEFLATQGKVVTLVEILDQLCADEALFNKPATLYNVKMAGVVCHTNSEVKEITTDGVRVSINGKSEFLPVQTVVLAAGRVPDTTLAESLRGTVSQLHVIGDADGKNGFSEAMVDGLRVGMAL